MSSAVFDTSPLCYLVLIGEISIAPRLFDRIFIPTAVKRELSDSGAPQSVREWIADSPSWLLVRKVGVELPFPGAQSLDDGEREAIWLAQALQTDYLVIDERFARKIAQDLGLEVTGLVGLLAKAQQLGLLDLAAAARRLRDTTFHVAPKILKDLLDRS